MIIKFIVYLIPYIDNKMDQDITYVTKLMNKLDINMDNKEVDTLNNLFNQMKISSNDTDINDLINQIDSLSIVDDNVAVKLNNNTIIIFRVYNCGLDHFNNNFIPKWCEGY